MIDTKMCLLYLSSPELFYCFTLCALRLKLFKMNLLTFTDKGIYCPQGDFYIDPWKPVSRAARRQ